MKLQLRRSCTVTVPPASQSLAVTAELSGEMPSIAGTNHAAGLGAEGCQRNNLLPPPCPPVVRPMIKRLSEMT